METVKGKVKILNEITESLKEWGKYNQEDADNDTRNSPDAGQTTKNTIELLLDNLALLNEVRQEHGCHGPLQCLFDWLGDLASKRDKPNTDLGAYWCWGKDFTQPKLSAGKNISFLDECFRWTSLVRAKAQASQKTNRIPASGQQPAETEQKAAPNKPQRESWLWKLYEKTLKAFFDSLLGKCGG